MIACVHRWCGACCEGAPLITCPPTGYTSDRPTLKVDVKPHVIPSYDQDPSRYYSEPISRIHVCKCFALALR